MQYVRLVLLLFAIGYALGYLSVVPDSNVHIGDVLLINYTREFNETCSIRIETPEGTDVSVDVLPYYYQVWDEGVYRIWVECWQGNESYVSWKDIEVSKRPAKIDVETSGSAFAFWNLSLKISYDCINYYIQYGSEWVESPEVCLSAERICEIYLGDQLVKTVILNHKYGYVEVPLPAEGTYLLTVKCFSDVLESLSETRHLVVNPRPTIVSIEGPSSIKSYTSVTFSVAFIDSLSGDKIGGNCYYTIKREDGFIEDSGNVVNNRIEHLFVVNEPTDYYINVTCSSPHYQTASSTMVMTVFPAEFFIKGANVPDVFPEGSSTVSFYTSEGGVQCWCGVDFFEFGKNRRWIQGNITWKENDRFDCILDFPNPGFGELQVKCVKEGYLPAFYTKNITVCVFPPETRNKWIVLLGASVAMQVGIILLFVLRRWISG